MTEIMLKRGYSISVDDEPKNTQGVEVVILGNYSKSNYNATEIVSTKGTAPTVRENHGQVIAIVEEEE